MLHLYVICACILVRIGVFQGLLSMYGYIIFVGIVKHISSFWCIYVCTCIHICIIHSCFVMYIFKHIHIRIYFCDCRGIVMRYPATIFLIAAELWCVTLQRYIKTYSFIYKNIFVYIYVYQQIHMLTSACIYIHMWRLKYIDKYMYAYTSTYIYIHVIHLHVLDIALNSC